MGKAVKVDGMVDLLKGLKGPAFKDVNFALRQHARGIADDMAPHVALAVSLSRAPQATAMAATVRSKPDRLPVVVIGKVNPKFRSGFTRRGGPPSARRRGSIAHGVIYGPAGGHRDTPKAENYYRIPRDPSGGALGRALTSGDVIRRAEVAYLQAYLDVLTAAGFTTTGG